MKIVKISLGIIVLLSVIFFATGLVVKEIDYTLKIVVNKPVKEVFDDFKTIDNQKKWMPELDTIEPISENPQKIGSKYRLLLMIEGKQTMMKQKILAFVPNQKIAYRFNSDVLVRNEDYLFEKQENTTKIIQHTRIRSMSYMLACTFPWFKRNFVEGSQEYLNNFKKFVEKSE